MFNSAKGAEMVGRPTDHKNIFDIGHKWWNFLWWRYWENSPCWSGCRWL